MILVMYHPEDNKLSTWKEGFWWDGYIPWSTIEICLEHGWEVIGEL